MKILKECVIFSLETIRKSILGKDIKGENSSQRNVCEIHNRLQKQKLTEPDVSNKETIVNKAGLSKIGLCLLKVTERQ